MSSVADGKLEGYAVRGVKASPKNRNDIIDLAKHFGARSGTEP